MKKRNIHSISCLLLCLVMTMVSGISCMTPVTAIVGTGEGACGEGVEWTLDSSTGELIISGEGEIASYGVNEMAPWFSVRNDVKTVTIKKGVSGITAMPFLGCSELRSIDVEEGNTDYKSENGVLFSADGLSLICYPEGKADIRYRVPEGVQRIEDLAFELCADLQYVALPDSVISIGRDAFANCTSLKKINMPDSVKDAATGIFYGCDSLKIVTVSSGLTTLPADTFKRCSALEQVVIPDSVTAIDKRAFERCIGLRRVVIPAGVTKIAADVFEDCAYLTDIYFGGSMSQWKELVKELDADTLKNVTVHYGEKSPASLYEYMFEDLSLEDWFYAGSVYALDNNIMLGTSDVTFSPNAQLTRAEMVQILYNYEGQPAVAGGTAFVDVAAGAWYEKAVAWASSKGVVYGVSETEFAPTVTLSREQMVTILYRFSQMHGYDTSVTASLAAFPDADDVAEWAQQAVKWAVGNGFISGYLDGTLHPGDTATRAQVAVVMKKYLTKMLEGTGSSQPEGTYEGTIDTLLMHPVMALFEGEVRSSEEFLASDKVDEAVWDSGNESALKIVKDSTFAAINEGLSVVRVGINGEQSTGLALIRGEKAESIQLSEAISLKSGTSRVIKITVTPSYGLSVVSWTSSDPSIATVDERGVVTGVKPGEVMITASAGTVSASCPVKVGYVDIDEGSIFFEDAMWCLKEGYIAGTTESVFGKDETITRGQMATYIWRMNGSPTVDYDKTYTDVDPSDYYYQAVRFALKNGLAEADSSTEFGASRVCNKGEAIQMIWRCQKQRVTFNSKLTDVTTSSNYYYPARWALATDVANGVFTTTVTPNALITKAETARLLHRASSIGGIKLDKSKWQVIYPQAELVLDQVGHDLKSAFKWSADMTYYGHNAYMPDTADPGIRWYANYGFTNHKGNCYVMAATFYEMAVNLGYSPKQMSGKVPLRVGGLGPHSWVTMVFNGTTYVFDPDFQHETGRNGYMITYGQSGTWRYQSYSAMGL